MRLRKPCGHNLYDAHEMSPVDRSLFKGWTDGWCPGGEFLPEGALVIEKVEGEWPVDALVWLSDLKGGRPNTRERLEPHFDALFDALASQVGESE